MPLPDKGPAPYAPGHAIIGFIEHVRDKGFPANGEIDQDFLVKLVGDSYARRTLRALEQLDLVDENGQPTQTLRTIKEEASDKLQETLAVWFKDAYAPVLTFVSPDASVEAITDKFRYYTPDGMRDRMVLLFLSLAEAAGLIKEVPRKPRTSKKTTKRGAGKPKTDSKKSSQAPRAQPPPAPPFGGFTPTGKPPKERYLEYLIGLAEKANGHPDPELLDRIERVLGVSTQEVSP